jgi:hypothetical protein
MKINMLPVYSVKTGWAFIFISNLPYPGTFSKRSPFLATDKNPERAECTWKRHNHASQRPQQTGGLITSFRREEPIIPGIEEFPQKILSFFVETLLN